MRKLRTGDKVLILAGKDKGKTGTLKAFVKKGEYVIVEGINKVTKFIKKGMLGQNQAGGKIKIEAPVHRSNVMVVCPKCGKATRIKIVEVDGKKFRACKRCGALVDKVEAPDEAKNRIKKAQKTPKKQAESTTETKSSKQIKSDSKI